MTGFRQTGRSEPTTVDLGYAAPAAPMVIVRNSAEPPRTDTDRLDSIEAAVDRLTAAIDGLIEDVHALGERMDALA